MTYTILVTGSKSSDKAVIQRALYENWEIAEWAESPEGFACLVKSKVEKLDPTYMVGRLYSFGTWGVKYEPTPGDIVSAVFRIAPKGAPA